MSFAEQFDAMEPATRERFRTVVTRLMSGAVLVRGTALRPDPDWAFTERHQYLIEDYLAFGGWKLDFNPQIGIARVVHLAGTQRAQFSKLDSIVVCMLRLLYHEQMASAALPGGCQVEVGRLRERLIGHGVPARALSVTKLRDSLRHLSRHQIVRYEPGFQGQDSESFDVLAVIERILSMETIQATRDRLHEYLYQRQNETNGDTGDESLNGDTEIGTEDEAEADETEESAADA